MVRRLLRRAIRHALRIGIDGEFIHRPAQAVIEAYSSGHAALTDRRDYIIDVLRGEERLFKATLSRGQKIFERECAKVDAADGGALSGAVAFHLYDTYGFPLELTEELASERGLTVDTDGFRRAFDDHRHKSQSQSAHVFKGRLGRADGEDHPTAYRHPLAPSGVARCAWRSCGAEGQQHHRRASAI